MTAQVLVAPPLEIWIVLTELLLEPTLKAEPGFVTLNVPLLWLHSWALDPEKIIISEVPEPKVTLCTVILPLAMKSLVAALKVPLKTNENAKIARRRYLVLIVVISM